MSKPRLKFLLFLQALITLAIPLFYGWGRQCILNRQRLPAAFFVVEYAAIALNGLIDRQVKKQMDEYAVAALHRAEANCFKLAVIWMPLCLFPILLGEGSGGWAAGWMLTLAIPALQLVRAGLFAFYDTKGMG